MRIAPHDESAGNHIALFHHYLMRNARARRIKVDPVLARERFDLRILLQIFRRDILNVVIDREHRLPRIGDRGRADLLEFRNHGAGVVVRHHMTRPNRNKIAGPYDCAGSESVSVTCSNLFDERETHVCFLLD